MRRGVIVFAAFVGLLSGCDSCSSCTGKAKAYLTQPPLEEYRKQVEDQIDTASAPATSMCGFPVKVLKDEKVTIAQEDPKRFRVEGKPIPKSDAGVDKSKVALCIGLVSVIAWPIVEGDKVTGYKWDPIVLEQVDTPGVKWTKPSSGGGGWD